MRCYTNHSSVAVITEIFFADEDEIWSNRCTVQLKVSENTMKGTKKFFKGNWKKEDTYTYNK